MAKKTTKFGMRLILLSVLLSLQVFADVPPDAGYVRQSADLVLESDADLSGYKFFLESPMKVEEIKIVAGTPTVVSALGRAGAMRFGKLIAIPASEVEQFKDRHTEEEFREALREKKLFTATQLLSHNFQTTIPEGARYQDPIFRIEKDGETGLKAVLISGGAGFVEFSGGIVQTGWVWNTAGMALVAGFFLIFGIAILGIWYFRRSSKHP